MQIHVKQTKLVNLEQENAGAPSHTSGKFRLKSIHQYISTNRTIFSSDCDLYSRKMGSEKKVAPDSKRAWIILVSLIFSLFASGGLQMSFGTIFAALIREFGESKSKTGNVYNEILIYSSMQHK